MSDLVNDQVKEEIMEDILEMEKDIWNVIFAIEKEFCSKHAKPKVMN